MALVFSAKSPESEPSDEGKRFSPKAHPAGMLKDSSGNDIPPKWYRFRSRCQISSVSVLPSQEEQKVRKFRLLLSIETSQDPSSQMRRTGNAGGIELEVEEKDLSPLARLTGSSIVIHYKLWSADVRDQDLEGEISELKDEIQHLRRKLRLVQDQLQFTVESQIKDSR